MERGLRSNVGTYAEQEERWNMGLAQYAVVAVGNRWSVLHDGSAKNEYETREAAFEAAAAAATLAIRQGHEVHLSVPGDAQGGAR